MLQLTTILFLITGSLLAAIHAIAVKLFLYWQIWWFDLPMHFFGGAVVTLCVFTLYDIRLIIKKGWLTRNRVLVMVLLVAIMWEVYEVLVGVPIEKEGYVIDTVVDLFLGMLGGYIGYLLAARLHQLN